VRVSSGVQGLKERDVVRVISGVQRLKERDVRHTGTVHTAQNRSHSTEPFTLHRTFDTVHTAQNLSHSTDCACLASYRGEY
jgi:hypothetical protein